MSSSRSSSTTSTSTLSSLRRESTFYHDLQSRAENILNNICNARDFDAVCEYVCDDVRIQHDDSPPVVSRDAYFAGWQQRFGRMPNLRLQVKEALVDDLQRKVWVRSELSGWPNGIIKESFDMMFFNEEGLLKSSIDCQRIKRPDDDGDEY